MKPGFGGLIQGQIYNPGEQLAQRMQTSGNFQLSDAFLKMHKSLPEKFLKDDTTNKNVMLLKDPWDDCKFPYIFLIPSFASMLNHGILLEVNE